MKPETLDYFGTRRRVKYWVGLNTGKYTAFKFAWEPTPNSHGHLYGAVIGPFRTWKAAQWAANHPHGYVLSSQVRG